MLSTALRADAVVSAETVRTLAPDEHRSSGDELQRRALPRNAVVQEAATRDRWC
jgi:hypothetical protein